MKRMMIALTACTLSFTSVLGAQTAASQPRSENIVTISFQTAVLGSAEAKKEFSALQAKFAPRKTHLQSLSDEIETMRKQLSSTGDKLNDSERNLREQSINSKEKQLEREAEDFKNDSQGETQQVFQRIGQKIYTFLQSYSQQHGYSVVIERGSDSSPVVWYAAGNVDITDQVVKAYDSQATMASPGSTTH